MCDGVYNVPIYSGKTLLGRAWLTQHISRINGSAELSEAIVLADIIIYDPNNRGKGIGDELMEFITKTFRVVMTGESTNIGKKLCMKWGFKMELHDDIKYLVFRRPKPKMLTIDKTIIKGV